MSDTIRRFGYDITKTKKTDSMPFNPIVWLCLDSWTTSEQNQPRITPQLMTEEEIDTYLALLHEDLDKAGKRAKSALQRAKVSTKKIVHDRKQ